ncbi:conserved hypothetical protein [Methylocella tundrae]|nr:conserved hypothetical protein [Methylocella tundrae]
MNKRLVKARRILEAQTEIDRLAGWTLIELQRQLETIEEHRHRLIAFTETEPAFYGLSADAVMRRLEALQKSDAALRAEIRAQTEKRLAERARMRGAEAIAAALEADQRRQEEQLRLMEVIEASVSEVASASSKPIGSS